jgi:hypothetical protein
VSFQALAILQVRVRFANYCDRLIDCNKLSLMTDITDATVIALNQHIPLNGEATTLELLDTQLQERQTNHQILLQEVEWHHFDRSWLDIQPD